MDQSSKPPSGQLQIRPLVEADLPFAQELRTIAGWNQTDRDWRRYLAYQPAGCFAAEWDGVSVGTVTTTSYGTDLAWIGMMLVHPDYRRRGIATVLMRTAIDYLQGIGVGCIKLDATPDGEPVYARLGFRPEWRLNRWEYVFPDGRDIPGSPSDGEIARYAELDRRAFGTDRMDWVSRLEAGAKNTRFAADGYGMIRQGVRANYVGPIVAADPDTACELVRQLTACAEGRTYWDIPEDNERAVSLAKELGFEKTRDLLRMWLGERNVAGSTELQFGFGDPSTG